MEERYGKKSLFSHFFADGIWERISCEGEESDKVRPIPRQDIFTERGSTNFQVISAKVPLDTSVNFSVWFCYVIEKSTSPKYVFAIA